MSLNGSMDSIVSFIDGPHTFENIYVRAGLILVYSFIFIICFFGNLAVILVLSLRWKRQSVSKFCLGNMAVANFSVLVFCILQHVTLFLVDSWIFGELMCKMYHFITNICHAASILMVVLISIERYLVILHPLICRQFLTSRKLVVIILVVWILSAIISLPNLFYFGLIPTERNGNGYFGHVCVPIHSMYYVAVVDTIHFFIMYLIPLIIMLALYLRIGLFLIQRERLGRDLVEEKVKAPDAFPGSALPRSSQKQPDGLNVEKKRPVRELHPHAVPDDLGSLFIPSDVPSSREGFRGQCLPKQQENFKGRLNMKELAKWRNHPPHAIHIESIHSHSRTTTSLSILQRRTAGASNPEALKKLYRYNRLQLVHMRCKQRQKVVRRLIFIVLTFAMLNMPHHLRKLLSHFLPSFDMTSEANNLIAPLTFALMYTNCAVNPMLYAFMSKTYRDTLREFCFGSTRNVGTV